MKQVKLAIHGGAPTISDLSIKQFTWPRISDETKNAVIKQLHDSISIYDKSGVIASFEDSFAEYHSGEFALLSNSGTSAIFSMYEGINLQQGDEVLCPVYTFHATVSPMMYTGAIPVFCDVDDQGNVSYEEVRRRYSSNTKAIIVTHMWGRPAKDIELIRSFCDDKGIFLLEDCSHAHGAKVNGRLVGSFGHASAWSLQGQKTITGGEGGIMLTSLRPIYERALLQGHYNKRPKQELSPESTLYKFYLTGFGQKFRAHPLAVAMAAQQFSQIDDFLIQRAKFAKKICAALSRYKFLDVPTVGDSLDAADRYSWYALPISFNRKYSSGVSREEFVQALVAEGLNEVDIPGSTGLLNNLPLFTDPQLALGRLYDVPIIHEEDYPNARRFTDSLIKLPVWTFEDERWIVDAYIDGFRKVADYLVKHKGLS